VLTAADLPARVWPLAARHIKGIGPKAAAKLQALGIRRVGERATCDASWLAGHFDGAYGRWPYDAAHGIDDRPLVTHSEPVPMSRETTFERNLQAVHDRRELKLILDQLALQVATDLQRKGYAGRTIGIKLRFEDFRTVTRDLTLPQPVADAAAIRHAAGLCLKRVDLARRMRLPGVHASGLVKL
jgi:DNA polymerase-4